MLWLWQRIGAGPGTQAQVIIDQVKEKDGDTFHVRIAAAVDGTPHDVYLIYFYAFKDNPVASMSLWDVSKKDWYGATPPPLPWCNRFWQPSVVF